MYASEKTTCSMLTGSVFVSLNLYLWVWMIVLVYGSEYVI